MQTLQVIADCQKPSTVEAWRKSGLRQRLVLSEWIYNSNRMRQALAGIFVITR